MLNQLILFFLVSAPFVSLFNTIQFGCIDGVAMKTFEIAGGNCKGRGKILGEAES